MTTEIYGIDVTPAVDDIVYPDGWSDWSGRLIDGDSFSEHRITTSGRTGSLISSLAVRVEVTGRTLTRKYGHRVVRVAITFLGDGEPDTTTGGFMLVPWR